uniref:Nuclear receptor domain-containing protein n=1 Tax=Syphacia muris TaxID=451379 RepID=A0A0N5AGT5_9BILA
MFLGNNDIETGTKNDDDVCWSNSDAEYNEKLKKALSETAQQLQLQWTIIAMENRCSTCAVAVYRESRSCDGCRRRRKFMEQQEVAYVMVTVVLNEQFSVFASALLFHPEINNYNESCSRYFSIVQQFFHIFSS